MAIINIQKIDLLKKLASLNIIDELFASLTTSAKAASHSAGAAFRYFELKWMPGFVCEDDLGIFGCQMNEERQRGDVRLRRDFHRAGRRIIGEETLGGIFHGHRDRAAYPCGGV